MSFKSGDIVSCINADGSGLARGISYEVSAANYDTVVLVGYETHGPYSNDRFAIEQHNTNAPDAAAAELEKITKLLDDAQLDLASVIGGDTQGDTYERVRTLLLEYVRFQGHEWKMKLKRLEAIK